MALYLLAATIDVLIKHLHHVTYSLTFNNSREHFLINVNWDIIANLRHKASGDKSLLKNPEPCQRARFVLLELQTDLQHNKPPPFSQSRASVQTVQEGQKLVNLVSFLHVDT